MSFLRAYALGFAVLVAAAQPAHAQFNVNPDAFLRTLPADEQRQLTDRNRGSLFDNMRKKDAGDAGYGSRDGEERFGGETPKQFFNRYLKCDEVRAGYGRTDACNATYVKYCKLFRDMPEDIQQNVAKKVECQLNGDAAYEDSNGAPASYGCAATDAKTLALLRKYYGKEEEMRSLIFFVDRMSRDLNTCTRGG